ncbi:MAG: MBL fold metallo-hydrolase [Chloroflexi bacterium]|nr:MAG: MBL fold metallo-hydrolase [Chloroflexota bacterium]
MSTPSRRGGARYDFAMGVWQEIGDRVWVRRYEMLDQTIGAVAGDDGLLIVDTRGSHRLGRELQADAAELSRPVRWVVNTHFHWDHSWGNAVFANAELWGHERCPPALLSTFEPEQERVIGDFPEMADDVHEVVPTPPRHLLTDAASIDLGERLVELRHLGRGHTDNDVVVVVPDVGALFVGDLLENGAPPYFGDSFPLDWPATADAIVAIASGPVAPGHGDVGDRGFAERQAGALRLVADLGRLVAVRDMTLVDAARSGPFGEEASRGPIERAAAQARGDFG